MFLGLLLGLFLVLLEKTLRLSRVLMSSEESA